MSNYLQENIAKYQQLVDELLVLSKTHTLSPNDSRILHHALGIIDAARLGLGYAMYSGGVYGSTLPFCKARNNKVFTLDEIRDWSQSRDRPRMENYDPFLHLGGNRCFSRSGARLCRVSFRPSASGRFKGATF